MNGIGYQAHGSGALDPEHWSNNCMNGVESYYTVLCDVCDRRGSEYLAEWIGGHWVCLDCFDEWQKAENKKAFALSKDVIHGFIDYAFENGIIDSFIDNSMFDYGWWLSYCKEKKHGNAV